MAKSTIITDPSPEPFFKIRLTKPRPPVGLTGLCVGYERKQWRAAQLAEHLMEWLPEFSLNWTERQSLRYENSVRLLRRAAANIYTTDKFQRRGEFGELFLHVAIRQEFGSSPAISKLYYKTASNDTVKGFDAVHIVGSPGDLELWLGEVKFYTDYAAAVRDVVKELHSHATTDYLRHEFAVITSHLDPKWPHHSEVQRLLSPNVSLDDVFSRVCVPVLLTYDSDCLSLHESCTTKYVSAFIQELESQYAAFIGAALPADITIHLFLLPLNTKAALIKALDKRLKQWQNL